jgi:hypothetical protein
MAAEPLCTNQITVRRRRAKTACEKRKRHQSRETRQVGVEVRAAHVTLRPPANADWPLPSVPVNVVMVSEVYRAEGEEPVEWILLTTLPSDMYTVYTIAPCAG